MPLSSKPEGIKHARHFSATSDLITLKLRVTSHEALAVFYIYILN